MKQQIVIFGNGKFAEQMKARFDADSDFIIVAFTINSQFIQEETFLGLPLVAFEEIEILYPPDTYKIFVAIGYTSINQVRESVYYTCREKGYSLVSYVSRNAIMWGDVQIGENSYIGDGVIISPQCRIGNGVIIFPNTVIGHCVVVEDFVYISICVAIGGYAHIRKNCFIGMHVTIRDHITVEEKVILGAAANLVSSTNPNSLYVGNPAKLLNKRSDQTNI